MITITLKEDEGFNPFTTVGDVLSLLKAHREGICQIVSISLNDYVITDIEGLLNNLIFI